MVQFCEEESMNIGVIFAGGVGTRMHGKEKPKQFLMIHNKPIIVHTIEHFEKNELVDAVVVCVKEWIEYFNTLILEYRLQKVKAVVPGGETGQLSIYNGLCAAKKIAGDQDAVVLIHDGVRPLINSQLLTDNIEAVRKYGNAITSGIVQETIIEISSEGVVKVVPDREHSRVAKAPQSFMLNDILTVHKKALKENKINFVDSCTMMKNYGFELHIVDGPHDNIKITTQEDFYLMRAILQAKEDSQLYSIY